VISRIGPIMGLMPDIQDAPAIEQALSIPLQPPRGLVLGPIRVADPGAGPVAHAPAVLNARIPAGTPQTDLLHRTQSNAAAAVRPAPIPAGAAPTQGDPVVHPVPAQGGSGQGGSAQGAGARPVSGQGGTGQGGTGQGGSGQGAAVHGVSGQGVSGQGAPVQGGAAQGASARSVPNPGGLNQTGTNPGGPNPAGPSQGGLGQVAPLQAEPAKPDLLHRTQADPAPGGVVRSHGVGDLLAERAAPAHFPGVNFPGTDFPGAASPLALFLVPSIAA
jgi:hypothetical protein